MTKMTLNRRLRQALGRRVVLKAEGFCSEEGRLRAVGRRMIRVSGQFFVQENLDQIVISRVCRRSGCRVTILTTGGEALNGRLVQLGRDFVELNHHSGRHRRLTLIPIGRVIGIERS